MSVKQISVFVPNKAGSLAGVTRFLADNKVNMKAFSIADSTEFGIMRAICEKPEEAEAMLRGAGYITKITNVLAVEIKDEPGSMASILEVLANNWISVEYTYAFTSYKTDTAYMMFRVNDNEKAEEALREAGIKVANMEDIF